MRKLDSRDFQLLFELMKNSRTSDRKLAKILGCSQPTVTRRRARLETNVIGGYTAIPHFGKIGFELLAFTFMKTKKRHENPEEWKKAVEQGRKWMKKQPNVIFSAAGEGMGWDGVCVSFHESFSAFAEFKRKHDMELSDIVDDAESFLVDMNPGVVGKPFHLKYLAETKRNKQV